MNLIGLTGGIGSGKSTVADIFRTLGIPVYDSDMRAKHIMNHDDITKNRIIALLGHEAYKAGELNRPWIASIVFSNEKKLNALNDIVHPAVYTDLMNWAGQDEQLAAPYLLQESAIAFEENLTSRVKAMILVVANTETRITRVMSRDNVTREHVTQRMEYQWKDEKKIPLSDYVIYNDHERSLITQVWDIDKMIKFRQD